MRIALTIMLVVAGLMFWQERILVKRLLDEAAKVDCQLTYKDLEI